MIESYTHAAIAFSAQASNALKRADTVTSARARGILRGAQSAARRAVEIRFHLEQAQAAAVLSSEAAWAGEAYFKGIASDHEIISLDGEKLKFLVSFADKVGTNDAENTLRAQLMKDILLADPGHVTKMAEKFNNFMNGDDLKNFISGMQPPKSEESHAVVFGLLFASTAQFDAEATLAISYDADRLAELYALAAWACRGDRALRKAAEAGARPVHFESKPAALFLLHAADLNYWHGFAMVAGLGREATRETMNYAHEGAMGRLGPDLDIKDHVFNILLQEAAKKKGSTVEETRSRFYQSLAPHSN